jgi:hypothetical protein
MERYYSTPHTQAHGCQINFEHTADSKEGVTYAGQIVPILRRHCIECHRDGAIGPWAMDSYSHVRQNSRTIIDKKLLFARPPVLGAARVSSR